MAYAKDVDLSEIMGSGWLPGTDTLEKIRDELTVIEGSGFSPVTDTLEGANLYLGQIRGYVEDITMDGANVLSKVADKGVLNDVSQAQINTQVDNALNTAIPGSPVADSMNDKILDLDKRVALYVNSYALSDTIIQANDTEGSDSGTVFVKVKEIVCPIADTIRIKFSLREDTGGVNYHGKIYKNGIAVGTPRFVSGAGPTEFSEDLAFVSGDTIELWTYIEVGPGTGYYTNFRVCGTLLTHFENTLV